MDLFGGNTPQPKGKEPGKKKRFTTIAAGNPMRQKPPYGYGNGPAGKKCKDCKFRFKVGKYNKCEFRRDTNGHRTDIRENWHACRKFEPKEE